MNTDHNGIDENTCRDPDSGSRNDTSANSNVGVSESFVISQRLKAKDPCVHEELLHRYQDRLLSYLRRLTSNAELATDLSQDVWVKVLTHGVQFQGKSQFSTWLYTIARNRVLDQWRQRSAPQSLESMQEEGREHLDIRAKDKGPFEQYADQEDVQLLANSVRSLRAKDRKLLHLHYRLDMSVNEIAHRTGISRSAIKARLYRAVGDLRRQVEADVRGGFNAMQPSRWRVREPVDKHECHSR